MAAVSLLSDADVGFGAASSAPKLLSDADVGFKPQGPPPSPDALQASATEAPVAGQPPQPSNAPGEPTPGPRGLPSPASPSPEQLSAPGAALDNLGAQGQVLSGIAARVGSALIAGWRDSPDILTPKAQEWLANAEKNNNARPNVQDVVTVGQAAMAAGNAVFRGGLEGISAIGDAVGMPLLGRDVAGYYEAMGMAGVPHMPGLLRSTMAETRAALTEQELGVARDQGTAGGAAPTVGAAPPAAAAPPAGAWWERSNNAAPVAPSEPVVSGIPTIAVRPAASTSAPKVSDILNAGNVDEAISNAASVASKSPSSIDLRGTPEEQMARLGAEARSGGASAPKSVGAAASAPDLIQQTASERSAADRAREARWMSVPRAAGFDDTRYVPGEQPLLYEIAGDPATSLEAKQLMQDPKYAGRFADAMRQNNQARTDFLNQLTGDATDVERLEAARNTQGDADRAALWKSKNQVDAQPVADAIGDILYGPAGKVDAVRTVMQKVQTGLYDADGNLETDPEVLYGVRKNIGTMLSKEARQQEPMNQHAAAELIGVRKVLDGVISSGAPSFPQYLSNFADASKPIDAMQVLQDKFATVFTGADRNLTFNQFDNRLRQIVKMRDMPGVNPAKSIPNEAMTGLFSLDSSLARSTNIDLGKARGSDTAQNMRVLGYTPEAIAHAVVATATGGNLLGNLIVRYGASVVKDMQAARKAKTQDALVDHHINPGIPLYPTITGETHGLLGNEP
jgi:hypothetical protein